MTRPLDAYPVGNMPNPSVESRRLKQWQDVYKSPVPIMLEDFRDRSMPPVIVRYREINTDPCYAVKPWAED